jgi:hypothetical protein
MDWSQIINNQGGWVFSIAMAAEGLRRLLKGDVVLGREYNRTVTAAELATQKAETLALEIKNDSKEQSNQYLSTIQAQRDLLLKLSGAKEVPGA